MADQGQLGAAAQDPRFLNVHPATIAPPAESGERDKTVAGRPARKPLPSWGRGGKELLGLMTFSHAVQHFYAALLPLVFPYVLREFGTGYSELGFILGITGILGGLMQGLAGFFNRVSARVLLVGQNVGLGVAAILAGIAPTFGLFGFARFFGALVSWPQHPIGSAILAHRFPERRGAALTWHTTGGSLGTVSIPILAGIVIANWGWRPALFIFAIPMILGGILLAFRLRDEHVAVGRATDLNPVSLKQALLRRGTIIVLIISTIAAGGRGLGVLNAFIPSYLANDLQFDAIAVSLIFSVLVIGSLVGPVIEGHFADRIGHLPILWLTYIMGAIGIAAYPVVGNNLVGLIGAGALIGLFAYADSALLQGLFSESVQGASQRAAFGIFFAIAYGVGSLWSPAIGLIIDNIGFNFAFYIMAGSFVLAAAVSLLLIGQPGTRR